MHAADHRANANPRNAAIQYTAGAICLTALPLLMVVKGQEAVKPAAKAPAAVSGVRMWEEEIAIPTYAIGEPEPNPIFYFGKQLQGAQGRVYPYPLYD